MQEREARLAPRLGRVVAIGLVLALELVVLSLLYNHNFTFECRAQAPSAFCAFLSAGVMRVIAILGLLAVFMTARPHLMRGLLAQMRSRPSGFWSAVHLAGFVLILLPWFFVSDAASAGALVLAGLMWLGGLALAGVGLALAAVPFGAWRDWLRRGGLALAVLTVAGALTPEIAALFQNVWKFDPLTEATFASAEFVLTALGYAVNTDPAIHLLGISEFNVLVGRQCSGVEGFMLITGFLAFYMWLFRADLRFDRVWILIPIGLMLSWVFNVVRISGLIMIGHHISPDLAIDGFHSHAGWLMFTILAVGLSFVAHQVAWLRRSEAARPERRALVPLSDDPFAALILPFIVFMASALLLSTFTPLPGLYYPLRFAAMAAVLWYFRRYLAALDWRLDGISILAGAVIGALWIATAPVASGADSDLARAIAGMSTGGFVLWVATRLLGTSFLVPVIEELFFRGYVQARIDTGGWPMRILAFAVSSGLFAALHDRWIAAFLAGVVFGALMIWRGRLSAAIQSHMAANIVIALWALAARDWAVI